MRVNFEVTDATRPILSVKKGCRHQSDDNLQALRRGIFIRDTAALQKIAKILDETERFIAATSWTRKQAAARLEVRAAGDQQQQAGDSLEPSGRGTREKAHPGDRGARERH